MNTKSNYMTIISKTKLENPELNRTMTFLHAVSRPYVMMILDALSKKPCRYSELQKLFIDNQRPRRGIFVFYLRKARKENLLTLDRLSGLYHITFRGFKAVELLRSVSKIANLGVETIQNANTDLFVKLEQNKSWLEPVIRKEINKAMKELDNPIVTDAQTGQRFCKCCGNTIKQNKEARHI